MEATSNDQQSVTPSRCRELQLSLSPNVYYIIPIIMEMEIENRPLDGISTLFVWFGENSSYIGLCSHHGQAETI